MYEYDIEGQDHTQEQLKQLIISIKGIVGDWTPANAYTPRIDHSEWSPDNPVSPNDSNRFPAGFIYEDILEFLLDLLGQI